MAFEEPILGGQNALVREAVKSPNYVAGASGWQLDKDGDAEFNSVVVRGTVEADGANGSYVKLKPGVTPNGPTVEFKSVNGNLAHIEYGNGLTVMEDSRGNRIVLYGIVGAFPALSNLLSIDTLNSGGDIQLASGNNIRIAPIGAMVNETDGGEYLHGTVFTRNISFASAASNTQTVTFPTAFPVGITPKFISCNINTSSGTVSKWMCRAYGQSNTGFTLWSQSGDGTSQVWSNVPVQFMVIV
jgi:hypothetical protein